MKSEEFIMDGNIFDNSVTVTPSLGQGEDIGTDMQPDVQEATTVTPNDGQVTDGADDLGQQGSQSQEVDDVPVWQKEFSSPEDLYNAYAKVKNSYSNLRPEYTKATQELSALKKSSQSPGQVDTLQAPIVAQLDPQNALVDKISQILTPVNEKVEELVMQNAVNKMAAEHPDFIPLIPSLQKVMQDNPALWNTDNPIEIAYKLAKAEAQETATRESIAAARNSAYADKEIKVINSGDRNRPSDIGKPNTKSEADLVKEGIMAAYNKKSIF